MIVSQVRFRFVSVAALMLVAAAAVALVASPRGYADESVTDSLVFNITSTHAVGDVGQYQQLGFDSHNAQVGGTVTTSRISVSGFSGVAGDGFGFSLQAAQGTVLHTGTYDIPDTTDHPNPAGLAFEISIGSRQETTSGRVVILDLASDGNGNLTRFDLEFFEYALTPVYNYFGEIRMGESEPAGYGLTSRTMMWPQTPVGSPNVLATTWLHNYSTSALTVGKKSITGPNAADFSIFSDACSGGALSAGSTCAIVVAYHPKAPGTRSAVLAISTANNVQNVALTGTAPSGYSQIQVSGPRYLVRSGINATDGPYALVGRFFGSFNFGQPTYGGTAFGGNVVYQDNPFGVGFHTPTGQPMTVGLHVTDGYSSTTAYGFDLTYAGGCSYYSGMVNVQQISYNAMGDPTQAYLTFTETCRDFPDEPLVGVIKWRLPAATSGASGISYLAAGGAMLVNATLSNGSRTLVLQRDGNLVLYSGGRPTFSTRTYGSGDLNVLRLQTDGNLVLYNRSGRALWQSHTHGTGAHNVLALQSDGNLVLYNAGGKALWSSRTSGR